MTGQLLLSVHSKYVSADIQPVNDGMEWNPVNIVTEFALL